MKTRIALLAALAALSLTTPGVARAQDSPPATEPRCSSCGGPLQTERCAECGKPIHPAKATGTPPAAHPAHPAPPSAAAAAAAQDAEDRRLDEALRKAYGDPNAAPLPEPTERPPEPRRIPPPPPTPSHEDEDHFRVRVGLVAAHWAAEMLSASVGNHARNAPDPGRVKLDGSDRSVADLGTAQTQTYHAWIDLGRWFSIQGGGRHAVFRDESNGSGNGFGFGSQFFSGPFQTKFEFTTADLDADFRPVDNKWGRVDLTLGLRYVSSSVRFTSSGGFAQPAPGPLGPTIIFGGGGFFPVPGPFPLPGPFPGPVGGPAQSASQTLETVMPMIGAGGTFRPVHASYFAIELFAHARIGGIAYGRADGGDDRGQRRRFNRNGEQVSGLAAASLEGEMGVTFLFFNTVGLTGGYHYEAVSIAKNDSTETRRASWSVGGPFLGLVAEF